MKKILKIEGMSCNHCVAHVGDALKSVKGVKVTEVNLEKGIALVDAKDGVSDDAMKKAVADAGYAVVSITAS